MTERERFDRAYDAITARGEFPTPTLLNKEMGLGSGNNVNGRIAALRTERLLADGYRKDARTGKWRQWEADETEYAVVRCRPSQSLRIATILKQGFTTAADAALWKQENAPGGAFQIARVIKNVPGLLTTLDQFEISKAIEEERRAA